MIETIVVIAIIGIVAVLVIPAFQTVMRHARLDAAARQVDVLMLSARGQAIKRGSNVGVVVSTDSSYSWQPAGWTSSVAIYRAAAVFVDANANGTPDAGETIIGVPYQLPEGSAALTMSIDARDTAVPGSTPTKTTFVFTPFGNATTSSGTNGVFFSDSQGNVLQVEIPVVAAGKVVMTKRNGKTGGTYVTQPWTWY